jgi:hypothetical protein
MVANDFNVAVQLCKRLTKRLIRLKRKFCDIKMKYFPAFQGKISFKQEPWISKKSTFLKVYWLKIIGEAVISSVPISSMS